MNYCTEYPLDVFRHIQVLPWSWWWIRMLLNTISEYKESWGTTKFTTSRWTFIFSHVGLPNRHLFTGDKERCLVHQAVIHNTKNQPDGYAVKLSNNQPSVSSCQKTGTPIPANKIKVEKDGKYLVLYTYVCMDTKHNFIVPDGEDNASFAWHNIFLLAQAKSTN